MKKQLLPTVCVLLLTMIGPVVAGEPQEVVLCQRDCQPELRR